MHEILKDFAGPVATIVAAIAAACIAYIFGARQSAIAKTQADIALDKLKYDLWKERYEIYSAAKMLVEYIAYVRDPNKIDTDKVRSLCVKIDEARFYFPDVVHEFLKEIVTLSEQFVRTMVQRDILRKDDQQWTAMSDKLGSESMRLVAMYETLPEKFEEALAFKKLTQNR
jgi:hypothetical protein